MASDDRGWPSIIAASPNQTPGLAIISSAERPSAVVWMTRISPEMSGEDSVRRVTRRIDDLVGHAPDQTLSANSLRQRGRQRTEPWISGQYLTRGSLRRHARGSTNIDKIVNCATVSGCRQPYPACRKLWSQSCQLSESRRHRRDRRRDRDRATRSIERRLKPVGSRGYHGRWTRGYRIELVSGDPSCLGRF